jgi:hypothetical protein
MKMYSRERSYIFLNHLAVPIDISNIHNQHLLSMLLIRPIEEKTFLIFLLFLTAADGDVYSSL